MGRLHRLGIELVLFPDGDEELRQAVPNALAGTSGSTRDRVEAALRGRYPALVVRERETLAELGPQTPTWYVFRDGPLVRARAGTAEGPETGDRVASDPTSPGQ